MYRNNFILTFSNFGEKENIGIYKKKNSRELIPVEDILLINDKTKLISRTILEWMIINKIASVYDYEKNEGIFNHMVIRNNEKDEYMIEFYLYKFDEVLVNRLNNYNWDFHNIKTVYYQIQNSNKNNFRGDYTLLYGNKYLKYKVLDKNINIRAGSFFQTNNKILQDVYADIKNILNYNINDIFLDLYCGVGIMTILVADKFKYSYGVEINKNAIDVAEYNKLCNSINNCKFICSSVEDIIDDFKTEDMIIFINPPRRGLYKSVIDILNLNKKNIKQLIYLSCCKETLERDLSLLNYTFYKYKEYNMFPNTIHTEYLFASI